MIHSNASLSVIFVCFVLINKGEQRISLSTVVSPPLWKSWESGDLYLCLFCFLSISHTETKKVHRISLKRTTLNHFNNKDSSESLQSRADAIWGYCYFPSKVEINKSATLPFRQGVSKALWPCKGKWGHLFTLSKKKPHTKDLYLAPFECHLLVLSI